MLKKPDELSSRGLGTDGGSFALYTLGQPVEFSAGRQPRLHADLPQAVTHQASRIHGRMPQTFAQTLPNQFQPLPRRHARLLRIFRIGFRSTVISVTDAGIMPAIIQPPCAGL